MIKTSINSTNIKSNYQSLKMDFVFNSMLEGHTPVDVYVNSTMNPNISIVSEGKIMYFGGETDDYDEYLLAIEFFKSNIIDEIKRLGLGFVKILFSSPVWEKALIDSLEGKSIKIYDRVLFNHGLKHIPSYSVKDERIQIHEINKTLIDSQLANTEQLLDEICGGWGDISNFYKRGFGYCAVKENEIIGWCTAEYMSDGTCGIGIETIERFQNQGVASSIASKMISRSSELGIVPHWDSWKWNTYSVKTAEKLGFEKLLEYKAIMLRL